jgi:hypothetical protein
LLGALSSVGIRGHANGVEEPRKAK